MSIAAWPELGRDIVRAIYDMIGQKMETLSQQVINRGLARDTRDPGDADRIAMLERLNEAYCTLGVCVYAGTARPGVLANAWRRSSAGSGQAATAVPRMKTSPPIHNQLTSGLT